MARYKDLKRENQKLRTMLAAFVEKHSVQTGDLLIFKTHDRRRIGESFGLGYAAMANIREMLSQSAGGPVSVLASVEAVSVQNLNREERVKLRALLDAVDSLSPKYHRPT